ncbi:MAG: Fic family protein [Deltaproteobacteria bacterium]|nr:Fic family protein [Deltaproteobacteria bacterium]
MYKPHYQISDKIVNHLTEIAVAREIVEKARLVPKWEIFLRREALIHSAHSSTHIEGNSLTLEEVSQLALGREISAIRKDKQEVLNYLQVLSNLEKYIPKEKFAIQLILQIHKDLVKKTLNRSEDEGVFRNRQVVVGYKDNEGRTVVTFQPPRTKEVPQLVQSFLDWLNQSGTQRMNSVLVAGIAHYEMVRIHPFIDGNGRTARTLATLLLLMQKFDTKRFFALDDYYDSDRMAYYAALKSVDSKTINITKWIEYFCEGVAFSVNRVKEKVLVLSGSKKATAFLEQVALTKRQMQIVEAISHAGKITSKEMQAMFKISPQAIHKEMKKLMDLKVVKLAGAGRGARYELV